MVTDYPFFVVDGHFLHVQGDRSEELVIAVGVETMVGIEKASNVIIFVHRYLPFRFLQKLDPTHYTGNAICPSAPTILMDKLLFGMLVY